VRSVPEAAADRGTVAVGATMCCKSSQELPLPRPPDGLRLTDVMNSKSFTKQRGVPAALSQKSVRASAIWPQRALMRTRMRL
jgi:hypothetical protein